MARLSLDKHAYTHASGVTGGVEGVETVENMEAETQESLKDQLSYTSRRLKEEGSLKETWKEGQK